MTLYFFATGTPKAQPRPRAYAMKLGAGKFSARMYDAGTSDAWKEQVMIAANKYMPDYRRGSEVTAVELRFALPRPKSHFTSKGALKESAPRHPTNKLDLDNLAKAVLDALTVVGMWADDGQITRLTLQKAYADGPSGCAITISPP